MKKLLPKLLVFLLLSFFLPLTKAHAATAVSTAKVTLVGDSISCRAIRYANPSLKDLLPNLVLTTDASKCDQYNATDDTRVGRPWAEGVQKLQSDKDNGKLQDIIIFALGTNNGTGGVSSSDIEQVINIASGKKIIFVTVYGLSGSITKAGDINKALECSSSNFDDSKLSCDKSQKKHDNVYIADWNSLVSSHQDWIEKTNPEVHPTVPDGIAKWNNLVASKVADASKSSSGSGGGAAKPVIVIDPGHSGTDIQITDPATGLIDHDYPNKPEISEVFSIAQNLKQKLEADGYTVIMTKNDVNDTVTLRKRADIANNAHADLAISIHDDHSQSWKDFAQIYVQKVGLHRDTASGKQISFSNADIAGKSQAYAQVFQDQRTKAEGHQVQITDDVFNNRSGISPGNIPLVELFANVPWVYNEVGASDMTTDEQNKYTQGLFKAIEKALPIQNDSSSPSTASVASCWITKVGSPTSPSPTMPPECQAPEVAGGGNENNNGSDILKWAKIITDDLESSQVFYPYLNRYDPPDLKTNPHPAATNGSYTAHIRYGENTGIKTSGIYWCTTLVIDAYQLSGFKEPDPAADAYYVPNMVNHWKTDYGSNHIFLQYENVSTSEEQNVLQQVQPGDAIMFEGLTDPHTTDQHVALVKTLSITDKDHGNGYIETYDSNGPVRQNKYPINNWHIKVTWGYAMNVWGFGQVKQ